MAVESGIKYVDHNNGYYNIYYNRKTFGEPRQRIWAVMRYEKKNSSDQPGWYIIKTTNNQEELKYWAKQAVDYPSSDGMGWVSNVTDIMIVEILPTDTYYNVV